MCFFCACRVKAYIENGWAHHVVNPDGHMQQHQSSLAEVDSSVSPPTTGWKKIESAFSTSTEVPKFTVSNTLNYFIKRPAVDGKATNDFKSMNSGEDLFRCGHVQALLVTDDDDGFWWVKADCRPEMKKDKMYKMVMSLCRGSWNINSTMCGCVAGKGPRASCKHIGALCYAVANFCLYGRLPDFLTCTDMKQVWNIPAQKKHQPTTVDQLKVRRRELLGKPSGAQPIPGIYDPRPPSLRIVNPQNSEQLRLNLLKIDYGCGLLQQLIPSDIYLKHDHIYCKVDPERLHDPPPAKDPVVMSPIPAVTDEQRQAVMRQLSVTASERLEVERLTRSQSDSSLWFEVRSKRITGSKCGRILCQQSKTDALLKSVLYPSSMIYKPVAIKWGIDNEKLARCVYIEYMKKNGHKGLIVQDCGFIVGIHEGYLGASPDGRIHDPSSDQPNGILEIKCPYTKRAQTPEKACEDPSFYCKIENDKMQLKSSHHYYHQVQLQLYVSTDMFHWCDFCVYTTKGCLATRITLDDEWVKNYVPKLKEYFSNYMLPEIMNPRLKPSYVL